ncbi:MAG: hypothetical protein MI863_12160, partial [Desulfobacterales bacterium]|nr:hypothetical protein [Desulfobacterales bacterium]
MTEDYISTSIFDIFKTGPGPSSSHTIGPMKAALMFRQAMAGLDLPASGLVLTVRLFGSLSLTGKGHGTHKAVLGGLLGWQPETCDCNALTRLLESSGKTYGIPYRGGTIPFTGKNIVFEKGDTPDLPFANTMRFRLAGKDKVLIEKEYYSVGGGFIQGKGEIPEVPPCPPHAYRNMNSLRKLMRKTGLSLDEIILENETALTGSTREEIFSGLDRILDAMCDSVERGLA